MMSKSRTTPVVREQARTLHRAIRLIHNRVIRAAMRDLGADSPACPELTMAQVNTLMTVSERGTATIKEIASANSVSAPSASAMVDRLVDTGVLTREQSRVDRREVCIQLTPSGRQAIERMEDLLLTGLEDILRQIEPECASKWCEVYEEVCRVLDSEERGPEGVSQP